MKKQTIGSFLGDDHMRMRQRIGWLVVIIGFVLAGASARGEFVLFTDPGTGTFRDDATGTIGLQFTPTEDITVTQLGFFDDSPQFGGPDGNANSHQVGLWTDAGTLLGSVTVQAGTASALTGEFRYEFLILPITLANGATYRIGAEVQANSTDRWHNNNTTDWTLGAPVTVNFAAFHTPTAGLTFPETLTAAGTAFIGPSFIGVPEPSSVVLLGVAVLAAMWRRRADQIRNPKSEIRNKSE